MREETCYSDSREVIDTHSEGKDPVMILESSSLRPRISVSATNRRKIIEQYSIINVVIEAHVLGRVPSI